MSEMVDMHSVAFEPLYWPDRSVVEDTVGNAITMLVHTEVGRAVSFPIAWAVGVPLARRMRTIVDDAL